MQRYRVVAGYVTVETHVGPGRARIDIRGGELLPMDVPQLEVEALLRTGDIELVDDDADTPGEVAEPDADMDVEAAGRDAADHEDDDAGEDDGAGDVQDDEPVGDADGEELDTGAAVDEVVMEQPEPATTPARAPRKRAAK